MKKKSILILASFMVGCASMPEQNKIDAEYAFDQRNPVLTGAFIKRDNSHIKYLKALRGPNGEKVYYRRLGSCCEVKSKNAPFGDYVPLDIYELAYDGITKTVTIYVNQYDSGALLPPAGFTLQQ